MNRDNLGNLLEWFCVIVGVGAVFFWVIVLVCKLIVFLSSVKLPWQ
jgi:hypothetical protein